jgi:hypothetical protein
MAATGSVDNSGYDVPPPTNPLPFEDWGLFEAHEDTELSVSLEQQGIALIAQSLRNRFDELSIGSADEGDERSDVDEDEVIDATIAGEYIYKYL